MTVNNQSFNFLKKHILKYGKTTNLLAWQALVTSFMFQAFAIYLIFAGYKILGWALHILTHVRFFVQFHDIAHFAFFQSIKLNKFFGTLLGIYMHIPFEVWREQHNNHHKDFGNLDKFDVSQSVLFTKKQYQQMGGFKRTIARIIREPLIFFLIVAPVAWFIGLLVAIVYKNGIFSLNVFQKLFSTFIFFCVLPLLGVPAVQLWVSLYITLIIGVVMFHLQHAVNTVYRKRGQSWNTTKAALQGSTYLQVPLVLKPFFAGIEYHHIHHINTNVPTYLIQECYDSFEKQGNKWSDYNINKVDYLKTIKSLGNVMYDQETKLLVPFSYKFW